MVLVAEAQTAGRGAAGPPLGQPTAGGAHVLRAAAPRWHPTAALLGWLPLLAGVAAVASVRAVAAVEAALKWPNDVLVGERKLGGILAERSGTAVVIGIGINVWQARADLPGRGRHVPGADGGGQTARRRALAAWGCASGCLRACWTSWGAGMSPGGIRPARETRTHAGCTRNTSAGAPRWAAR